MLKKLISLFATLLFFGVVAAQNQNDIQEFLNNQFLILEQVQPLTQAERERMESIFHREFADSGNRDIAFNTAMSRTLESLDYYEHYWSDHKPYNVNIRFK
jgi:hypothetical protein